MKLISLAAALAATVPAVLGSLTINTPTAVTVCEPTALEWSGGTGPYYLSIIPAGQVSAPPYETLPTQNGTSYTWLCNLPNGYNINFEIKDGNGDVAYSSLVTIQAGSSTDCINSSVSSAATNSGASPTASSGSGTSTTESSGSGSTPTSSGSSPSSTSTKSSGADRLSVSSALSVAGIMGLVGAALF